MKPVYFSQTEEFITYIRSIKGGHTKIPLICRNCNITFLLGKNEILGKLSKNRKDKFCSRKCAGEYKSTINSSTLICFKCGVSFTRNNGDINDKDKSFCSLQCSCAHTSIGRKKPINICSHPECNTIITKNAKTCNKHKYFEKLYVINNAKTDRTRRIILIRINGNICSVCNNSEWNDCPIPLELHHIDGNSDNNNSLNLQLICPNCHALTPSYKGSNKGNSTRQISRRNRYHNGQTF